MTDDRAKPTSPGEDREQLNQTAETLAVEIAGLVKAGFATKVPSIILGHLAAARSQGVREERERWLDCAQVDATMEGPKLRGWNRSALDRFWRDALAARDAAIRAREGE